MRQPSSQRPAPGPASATEVPQPVSSGALSLSIATCNASSWASFKNFLDSTDAHVVLGQELRRTSTQISEASAWAKERGGSLSGSRRVHRRSATVGQHLEVSAYLLEIGWASMPRRTYNRKHTLRPGSAMASYKRQATANWQFAVGTCTAVRALNRTTSSCSRRRARTSGTQAFLGSSEQTSNQPPWSSAPLLFVKPPVPRS